MILKYLMVSCSALALSFGAVSHAEAATGKTATHTKAKVGKKTVKAPAAKHIRHAAAQNGNIRKVAYSMPREAVRVPLAPPNVMSQAVLVQDQNTGEVLFERNSDAVVPIASITKLMTAMVVLDAHPSL